VLDLAGQARARKTLAGDDQERLGAEAENPMLRAEVFHGWCKGAGESPQTGVDGLVSKVDLEPCSSVFKKYDHLPGRGDRDQFN
jgi:hypothetical protein